MNATDRDVMIAYLNLKVRQQDWHGVADAANDLREMDAATEARRDLLVENAVGLTRTESQP